MAAHEHTEKERLAHIEALMEDMQPQLDRRFKTSEELFAERIGGLRTELGAINSAQKEAVDKTEKSVEARLNAAAAASNRKDEVNQQRLAALEQSVLVGEGARKGASEFKASTVAWIGAVAALGLILVSLLSAHVI